MKCEYLGNDWFCVSLCIYERARDRLEPEIPEIGIVVELQKKNCMNKWVKFEPQRGRMG